MRTRGFDIELMVSIRLAGGPNATYSALGRRFERDHTTILYHCRRLGLPEIRIKSPVLYIEQPKKNKTIRPHTKYATIFDEPKCAGKSYKEYLKEAMKRPVERRYFKTYYETPFFTTHSTDRRRASYIAPYNQEEGSEYNTEGS